MLPANATDAARKRARALIWPAALAALVALAFAPAFRAEFVSWDDPQNVSANYAFRGLDAAHIGWMFETSHMGPYQPLAWLSLAVDHALWGLSGPEDSPEAPRYHATSVALHALAAIAVFYLARRLLAIASGRAGDELAFSSFVAAAVFAVHPLRVESVAWVTERRDVLCGLFTALAALTWLRAVEPGKPLALATRDGVLAAVASAAALALATYALDLSDPRLLSLRPFGGVALAAAVLALVGAARLAAPNRRAFASFGLALACFLAALLSKGLALVLPAALIALDVWPLRRILCARSAVAALVEKLPLFALSAVFARLAMWGQASIPGVFASWEEHTLGERALQAAYGLAFYVRKTLLPTGLSPLYDLPGEIRASDPRFLLSASAVAIAAAALIACRKRAPAVATAAAAYALAIAPVLGFSQAGPQLVADRYSYLACLPFALLAGGAPARWRGRPARSLAVAAIVALAVATFVQTKVWRSSTTLWERAVEVDPDSRFARLKLANARIQDAARSAGPAERDARLADAERLLQSVTASGPSPRAYAGLALLHKQRFEIDPRARRAEAEAALDFARRALELATERDEAAAEYRIGYASALCDAQRFGEAIPELESILRDDPHSFAARFNLGFALLRTRRFEEAVRQFELALALEPGFANAWGNLGVALEALGERTRAAEAYRRVLELQPGNAMAREKLAALGAGQ